jgi:hypothetical protein
MIGAVTAHWADVLLWGLLATVAMTSLLSLCQTLGFTRLSMPFLFGTFFTANRARANVVGFVFFALGGWVFTFIYFLVFAGTGVATWWMGCLLGFGHCLFFLTAFLGVLPYVHPRMASEYDGPTALRWIEPPGRFGMNYGFRTPLVALAAFLVYGGLLGALYGLSQGQR